MRGDFRDVGAVIRPPAAVRWPHALAVLLLLGASVVVLYRDTAAAMVQVWSTSETFAHAWVVPPIAAWLAWRQRHAVAAHAPQPTALALPAMAAAGLLWLAGDLAAVNAAGQFAMTAMLVLCVFAVLGCRATRELAFPLGFLFFAVPVGEFLMPRLMLWTADFTTLAVRASGVPVFREGQQLVIPTGTWSVVEACSGIRYLIASAMVGTLFAYLHYRSLRRRLLFVGVAILVPIVANWVRAYGIVMLGHLSNNRIAAGVDHLVYGWVFFGVVIVPMFLIGARWKEPATQGKAPRPAEATGGSMGTPARTAVWKVALPAAVLVAAPLVASDALTAGEAGAMPVLSAPSELAGGWRAADGAVATWRPAYRDPPAEANRVYVDDMGRRVGVYIAYYRGQDERRKLVSALNVVVTSDDPRWFLASQGRRDVQVGSQVVPVRTARLRRAASRADGLAVWRFYWINGTLVADDVRAKLSALLHRLAGRGDDAAAVVLYTPVNDGVSEAVLEEFLTANLALVTSQLAATRDGD